MRKYNEQTGTRILGIRQMRRLPKILIHEHLDCSLRPRTMLELWSRKGFDQAKISFPADVLDLWSRAEQSFGMERRQLRAEAVTRYQKFLVTFASASLANYVQAIIDHVLPVMQTKENLTRITRERLEDAAKDGIIAMELRFAPQLHTWGGLSLEEVMNAVLEGAKNCPFALKLIVCALRHEDGDMARKLARLCIKYRRNVGLFDLAADEAANPGLLRWWLKAYLLLLVELEQKGIEQDMDCTNHLWETNNATDEDIELLDMLEGNRPDILRALLAEALVDAQINVDGKAFDKLVRAIEQRLKRRKKRVGHGLRGNGRQAKRVLELCPTSNHVTGQVATFSDHPIDEFLREGKLVTVNTDGTLFTEVQLSDEYRKLQKAFGWTPADFLRVNLNALEASSFPKSVKARLRSKLSRIYSNL